MPLGANQATEILAVKSAATALAAAKSEDRIRAAVAALDEARAKLAEQLPAQRVEDQDQTSVKGTATGDSMSAGQATPDTSVSLALLDAMDAELSAHA